MEAELHRLWDAQSDECQHPKYCKITEPGLVDSKGSNPRVHKRKPGPQEESPLAPVSLGKVQLWHDLSAHYFHFREPSSKTVADIHRRGDHLKMPQA